MQHTYEREYMAVPLVYDTERLRRLDPDPELAEALDEWDAAWNNYAEADTLREDAEANVRVAENADGAALRDALLAGGGDTGTEATDKAHRAAIVAQERLRLAIVRAGKASDNLWTCTAARAESLRAAAARAELEVLDRYSEMVTAAIAALDACSVAAREIGQTWDALQHVNPATGHGVRLVSPDLEGPDLRQMKGASVAQWYTHQLKQYAAAEPAPRR